MRKLWLVVPVLVLSGCSPAQREPAVAQPASAVHPDLDWTTFPVDRKPRPIILLDPLPKPGMELTLASAPTPPATMPVTLPDGVVSWPTINAEAALLAMGARRGGPSVPATLASASFDTDRGKVTLPVWRFGTVEWPALEPSVFWKLGKLPRFATENPPARLDGLKLTVSLLVSREPCPGSEPPVYRGVAKESATTVTVYATADNAGKCLPGDSEMRPFEVTLPSPLGARVLVYGSGSPIAVNP
ncbi:hypothetical protein LWC34_34425 [Kibdelosporangium philippinense]|uniref:Lipoprotein n=1 Tax=Kibdelosporangium philippinense TaxID=211113 RepID=A0ABS8ZJD4_9PSEU|nr:hypothetical protein [Kibdelosporangium philippinense]MCE7007881.1 hypothetical protein [Kibdelosporangium philippinense]